MFGERMMERAQRSYHGRRPGGEILAAQQNGDAEAIFKLNWKQDDAAVDSGTR